MKINTPEEYREALLKAIDLLESGLDKEKLEELNQAIGEYEDAIDKRNNGSKG